MAFVIDDITVEAIADVASEAASEVSESAISSEFASDAFSVSENLGGEKAKLSVIREGDSSSWNGQIFNSVEKEFDPEIFNQEKFHQELSEVENCAENSEVTIETEPRQIKTINSYLEGQNHPDTGVPFEKKTVMTDTGETVEGVFPKFESKFDAQLPEDLYLSKDAKQFQEANRQLKLEYDNNAELRKQFNERQRDEIESGYTPYGYTWHHNEEMGKMQLVEYDTHQRTAHTGGRSIWGGGSENR